MIISIITYHEKRVSIMDKTRRIILKRHLPAYSSIYGFGADTDDTTTTADNTGYGSLNIHSKVLNRWLCPSHGWACHAILDGLIDSLIPEVESIVSEIQTCEEFVFVFSEYSQTELLQRMQLARGQLVIYRHRLWPKSTITHNLLLQGWRKFVHDVPAPYWRDVNDHVARMVDSLQLAMQTLENLQNVFVAKVNLDMTKNSYQLSEVAGKLGSIGSVFLPLTLISGIWGMNCNVPFQSGQDDSLFGDNLYRFAIVLTLMILLASGTYNFVK